MFAMDSSRLTELTHHRNQDFFVHKNFYQLASEVVTTCHLFAKGLGSILKPVKSDTVALTVRVKNAYLTVLRF